MENQKYALISVADKRGVIDFGLGLEEENFRVISTGGTAKKLNEGGVDVISVSEWTGMSEMMDGRVKTLHPSIHAGILADRDKPRHMKELEEKGWKPIDLVAVNLYDFRSAMEENDEVEEMVEKIDIGGPTLVRAAAKNFESVTVVTRPGQYDQVLSKVNGKEGIPRSLRRKFAKQAFEKTSRYDRQIQAAFTADESPEESLPDELDVKGKRKQKLRYGENPHQDGSLYTGEEVSGLAETYRKHHGKELSANNVFDLNAVYGLLKELEKAACVVVKHGIPIGVSVSENPIESFRRAHEGDPVSAFGSVVGFNTALTREMASELADPDLFIEGIMATEIEEGIVDLFKEGPSWGDRVRLISATSLKPEVDDRSQIDVRDVSGGFLCQTENDVIWNEEELDVVTGSLTSELRQEMKFAWTVCKHVRSNAIVLTKNQRVLGVGAGQPSRVDAAKIAVRKAGEEAAGSVVASDAFFPFPDALEEATEAGAVGAIQPGGSIRDEEVIEAAEEAGITMIFTGIRHFLH